MNIELATHLFWKLGFYKLDRSFRAGCDGGGMNEKFSVYRPMETKIKHNCELV